MRMPCGLENAAGAGAGAWRTSSTELAHGECEPVHAHGECQLAHALEPRDRWLENASWNIELDAGEH